MKTDVANSSDSLKTTKGNKSKILYKFKISDSTPTKKKYMGQYFLIDLNHENNKNFSQSKSNKKLVELIYHYFGLKVKIKDIISD